jgi:hypothetical protein
MAKSKKDRIAHVVSQINTLLYDAGAIITWTGAPSQARIAKTEKLLGLSLPVSYKEFVNLVGGGGPEDFAISGIPRTGALEHSGSIVCQTWHWREEWVPSPLPDHLAIVQHDEEGTFEPYCLDASRMKRGECPVVTYYPHGQLAGTWEDVSKDFVTFFEEQIASRIETAGKMTPKQRDTAIQRRNDIETMLNNLKTPRKKK